MVSVCGRCGVALGEEHPQINGMCIECLADAWDEIIEISPLVSLEEEENPLK